MAFNIIYSSGTTGTPKGIVQSHAHALAAISQRGGGSGYGPDAVTLFSTPLYSNTTLVSFFPTLAQRRHGGADGEIRRAQILELAQKHTRHPRDAGAGAVPPPDGTAGFRQTRPVELRA